MWRDVFSCEFPYSRNVKEYPILIGIMRFYQEKKIDLFISAYQFKKLLQGEILRTENIYIEKILIDKLALFKAESDENKRSLVYLSSDAFIETILSKLKSEQIVSLRLNRNFDPIQSTSKSFHVFYYVTSLHLYNFYDV
ncbi:unnamed protein product, partial [Rotaria sp. Silwood1]